MSEYTANVDRVIYGDGCKDFTRCDFLELAIAAIDQAAIINDIDDLQLLHNLRKRRDEIQSQCQETA